MKSKKRKKAKSKKKQRQENFRVGEVKETDTYKVIAQPLSKWESTIMEFHWLGRIPYSSITLFYGLAGQNKSSMALDVAARTSKGLKWPDGFGSAPQGSTLYIGCEDPIGSAVRPRYEAMGGDANKLIVFEGIEFKGEKQWLDLSKHLSAIEDYIAPIPDLKQIIFDPFNAFLGWSKNPWDDERIRRIIGPVHQLAEKYKIAIIGILHANKNEKQNLVHRISGSAAWGNLARSIYIFGKDENDAKRRFMSPTKMSYGLEKPTLAFRIIQTNPKNINSIKLDFEERPILKTAEEIFGSKKQKPGPKPVKKDSAKELLKEHLLAKPLPVKEIKKLAKEADVKKSCLYRAKESLKIKTVKPKKGEHKNVLCWRLPQTRFSQDTKG